MASKILLHWLSTICFLLLLLIILPSTQTKQTVLASHCPPGQVDSDFGCVPQGTVPLNLCPSFVGLNPQKTQFNQDQQIGIVLTPPEAANPPNEYELKLKGPDTITPLQEVTLNGERFWTATVGPLELGDYSFKLRKASLPQRDCFEGGGFSVVNIVSGKNPCESGVCKTALGDIDTDITKFAAKFLSIAIGLAGGLALILLVYGSIRVLTSSGNQQSLAAGRDVIIAAIAGLLFLIFSVLILRTLGLIIGIPFV